MLARGSCDSRNANPGKTELGALALKSTPKQIDPYRYPIDNATMRKDSDPDPNWGTFLDLDPNRKSTTHAYCSWTRPRRGSPWWPTSSTPTWRDPQLRSPG